MHNKSLCIHLYVCMCIYVCVCVIFQAYFKPISSLFYLYPTIIGNCCIPLPQGFAGGLGHELSQ